MAKRYAYEIGDQVLWLTAEEIQAQIDIANGIAPKEGTDDPWTAEREDVLRRFGEELRKATGDGSKKRQAGEKPAWYRDNSHEGAIFSHLTKWKRGEKRDKDSGAHPLVHAAWRCLAIACSESGNVPEQVR